MKTLLIALMLGMLGTLSFAQDNLSGIWKTENNNTLVKIERKDGARVGKIFSSDNKEMQPGTQIMRNVKLNKGVWEGQLYAPMRNEWYDAKFCLKGDKLEITVSVGFFSKTIVWLKVKS